MLVSNRDTACAFREGYGQDGRPLYHGTLSVRLREMTQRMSTEAPRRKDEQGEEDVIE